MGKKDRVRTAIEHRVPDKVPCGEIGISKELTREILKLKGDSLISDTLTFEDHVRLRERLKWDLVNTTVDSPFSQVIGEEKGKILLRDIWGNVNWKDKDVGVTMVHQPAISHPDRISKYRLPSPDTFPVTDVERWVDNTDLFVFANIDGPFTYVWRLLGLETFCISLSDYFDDIKNLMHDICELHCELARKSISAGADAILISDDLAFKNKLLLSPDMLRKLIFPILKIEVEKIKRYGAYVFFHTDGDIKSILNDIIGCGFDGVQSLEPSAGVSLEEVKHLYGNKICLMGNIDINLLCLGKPEDIEESVKKAIEIAAPGGGYIISASNALMKGIPAENVIAMYDAIERYGTYVTEGG